MNQKFSFHSYFHFLSFKFQDIYDKEEELPPPKRLVTYIVERESRHHFEIEVMAWSATGLFAIKAANITTCLLLSPAPLLITFYRPSSNCFRYLTVLRILYVIKLVPRRLPLRVKVPRPILLVFSLSLLFHLCVCVWPLLAAVQPRIRLLSDARTESR